MTGLWFQASLLSCQKWWPHDQPKSQRGTTLYCTWFKGQEISKQNCRAIISPKKRTDIFVFAILTVRKYLKLGMEIQVSSIPGSPGKKNKRVRLFFGRSYCSTILFRDLLTFSRDPYVVQSKLRIRVLTYLRLEIRPCGLGSRIRDMEAESHNWSHFLNLW